MTAFDAAWLGVYWHGYLVNWQKEAGSYGVPQDIIKYLPKARKLIEGR